MERKKSYRKITGRWRRILSSMLMLAMLLSSVPTTGAVYAAELPTVNVMDVIDVVESSQENVTESTVEDSSEMTDETMEETSEESVVESASDEPVETVIESVEETLEVEEESGAFIDDTASLVDVTFRVKRTGATSALLAGGAFSNGWNGKEMTKVADGVFTTTESLAPGDYSGESGYKIIFGSEWYPGDNQSFTVPSTNSISIDGNTVTITYTDASAKKVYIAGGMNGWSDSATEVAGSNGTYTYTEELSPGHYPYKFVVNYASETKWKIDPNCPNFEIETDGNINVNSFFIIPGLQEATKTLLKGEEGELPATLNSVDENGIESAQNVTYTVKDEANAEYVTIDGNKVTVSQRYTGESLELTATAENGQTSTVTLELVDQQYTYTVYARSNVDSHMYTSSAALWIWDEAGETSVEAADYNFTEKVTLEDGNEWLKAEVVLPYANKLGFIYKSLGSWAWKATSDLFYSNKDKTDVTLYIIEGQNEIFTSLQEIPSEDDQRYVIVDYTSASDDYTDMNVYAWDNGYEGAEYPIQLVNGSHIAKIPVVKSSTDKEIGFLVKKGYIDSNGTWDSCEKEGGDNLVTVAADQKYVKVRFENGAITAVLPDNCGTEVDRKNNIITFYYRNDDLFVENNEVSLSGKVKLVVKSSTGKAALDGSHNMSYDATNERYVYTLPLQVNTDYNYYYDVDGTQVLDAYNKRTNTIDGVEYSLFRNKKYEVNLIADVKNSQMDYNDNNLLYLNWEGKNGANIEGFTPEKIYADLSELGLGNKVEINTELNAITFSCKEDISLGNKTIKVTVIDDCDNTFTTETDVTVVERTKKTGTESKLGDFDWDEAVIYFAVTDRFFDGNTSNNTATAGYDPNDETDQSRYHGGDFAGLTAKMDYLYDLGVNTIWITPIVDQVDLDVGSDVNGIEYYAYHGYWAEDFTRLNPHLGNEDEFEALIDAAHARGMKIMVDVVLNHAGYESTDTFNSILTDGEGNYINMIRGEEDTIPNDEKKDGLSGLPDFLTENEAVRNQLVEWQTDWMTKYDIDYYRVDTVKHVENTTWEAFKNSLTESNPDFKMIGEYYDAAFGNTYGQLDSGKMDSLLDFGFKYYAENFVGGSISSVESQLIARNNGIDNTAMLGSFLSSHDEDGLLYKLKNKHPDAEDWAEGLMKVAATLQITAKGQPVIYYGEEIGQSGANNYPYYDNRYDFDWDAAATQAEDANSFLNHYKKVLNIRRDYSEVFAKGTRTLVAGTDAEGYDVIRRSYNGTSVYVGMNVFGEDKTTKFPVTATPGSTYTDLYSGNTYTVAEDCTITVTIPNARKGGTSVFALTDGEETEIKDTNTITIKLHYFREDGQYTTSKGDWNVWMWADEKGGAAYDLVEENGDMVATMEVEGRKTNKVGFIVRLGDWKDQEGGNRFIDVSDVVSGTVHVYVKSGVDEFTRVLGADAILGCKIVSATYDRDNNKVVVVTSQPIPEEPYSAFAIKCTDGTNIDITKAVANGNTYTLTIAQDLTSMKELVKSYSITYDGYEYGLTMPNIYSSDEFESKFTYKGKDLGATWTEEATTFKVWAPTAQKVQLALYEAGDPKYDDRISTIDMKMGDKGVWSAVVEGDLNGTYYTYLVSVDGKVNEACDPYATTTGVNGKRAMVIDMDSTDPEGWSEDVGPHKDMEQTDAIIYELHVRDLSIDDSSGVSEENKGKYLGVVETGTTTENGVSTGLDHMVDMGVTHVHLLPVYDYGSVKEDQLDTPQFNWGYDPVNFNVPEGSYSSDPYEGEVRVKEFKQMVKGLHDNNINVVMDVVYNHVYDADSYCFNQIVPKYFSRTNADGSYNGDTGCGNTTASERSMVHKYIVDSILYWHNEYHIDGFRFDLVGLIDAETINAVVSAVHEIDPDIIFYGEGWDMSSGTTKGDIPMATQGNAYLTPGFAYFSDTFRDNLAGKDTNGQGFVLGYAGKEGIMQKCFTATTDWCPSPEQTINYASCHDNYTLMDKLNVAASGLSEADRIKMNNLSAAFYMLSEGVPFIHAGEEFLRTKVAEDGEIIHNSYNSPDYVNKLRWYNLEDEKYADVAEYYKGLIKFRKNHEALRLSTAEEVKNAVSSHKVEDNLLLFEVAGKEKVAGEVSDGIVVIFNSNKTAKTVNLSTYGITGDWTVCINGEDAGTTSLGTVNGTATVDAISALVLVKGATQDFESVYDDNFRETIALDESALRLKVNATATLTATTNAETTVTWGSDNEEVATVSETGLVTAVAPGTAVITAATAGGAKATCTVTVTEHLYVLNETQVTLDLTKVETKTLEVTNEEVDSFTVTWASDNEEVAAVSETGLVTPVAVGTATITAKVTDGPELTCTVTVTRLLESIAVSETSVELGIGERKVLHAILTPADVVTEVKWYSSDSLVATVDRATGEVKAVGAGTATITAKADGKTATCEVTVKDTVPVGITAITNIHTKLGQVPLPSENWSWAYPDIQMKSFAGLKTKNFMALYKDENGDSIEVEIPVSIVTVSKVNVTLDSSVVEKDSKVKATANFVTIGGNIPEELISKVEWKTSKATIATVERGQNDVLSADVTGINKGTAKINAVVTLSDGTLSKTFTTGKINVKVTDPLAQIDFKDIQWEAMEKEDAYKTLYVKDQKVGVTVASTSSKVTIKSSDAKIVAVGRVTRNADNDFVTTLTIKKAGYVKLTAISNDAAKTQTSIELYVKDAAPNVSSSSVDLNNKSAATASVFVYPNEEYDVQNVNFDSETKNSEYFSIEKVGDTSEYKVSLKDVEKEGKTYKAPKGNYKQNLLITVDGVTEPYKVSLTVKVASKVPSVSVKQTEKVNLFYNDEAANGSLTLTSAETITNAVLTDCGYEYDHESGQISVKADGDKTDKKGILTISFEGYAEPVKKNITIATVNKKPTIKLSAKSAVLYPAAGITSASVTLTDTQTGNVIAADEMEVTFKANGDKYAYEKADNTVTFTRVDSNFKSKVTANIAVARDNYTAPVILTYAISVNTKTPSIAVDKKTVTLNKNGLVKAYETAVVNVSVKDAVTGGFTELKAEPADNKTKAVFRTAITRAVVDATVTFGLKDTEKLKNGNYKFKITGKNELGDYKSAVVTVKIVDVAPEKTVKLTKSGNIDVLNRDTTKLIYKPKLSNITGNITDVSLAGRSAHLFDAKLVNGNIEVTVKGGDKAAQDAVNLITKYNYGIKFRLTLENEEGTYKVLTTEQKFKLTQSKPKVTVSPKQSTMFNTVNNNQVYVAFKAANKNGSEVVINRIELTNFNNAFAYDMETGILSLTGRGDVVKGKSYSLKFNVYCDGYADNEKPITVTYKVKVN